MTDEMRTRLANHVAAAKEEAELETLVSVLGTPEAQRAVKSHTLSNMVAFEQGHGTDHNYFTNSALNRRAA